MCCEWNFIFCGTKGKKRNVVREKKKVNRFLCFEKKRLQKVLVRAITKIRFFPSLPNCLKKSEHYGFAKFSTVETLKKKNEICRIGNSLDCCEKRNKEKFLSFR